MSPADLQRISAQRYHVQELSDAGIWQGASSGPDEPIGCMLVKGYYEGFVPDFLGFTYAGTLGLGPGVELAPVRRTTKEAFRINYFQKSCILVEVRTKEEKKRLVGSWLSHPLRISQHISSTQVSPPVHERAQSVLTQRFKSLVAEWKTGRPPQSLMAKLASHHAYQRIIGMGDQAIPLLLRELQREVDLWFWALEAITGEDPVRAEHRGNIDEMARDWIIWGKERGYLD